MLNGAFYSKKQRKEMDKVEELHRCLNHISARAVEHMANVFFVCTFAMLNGASADVLDP